MTWPVKSLIVLIALPVFTVCAATLYYYHVKDKEWKRYLNSIKKIELEFEVPLDLIGSVIGRGGANIRDIQETTQTKIKFKKQNGNERSRICRIFGDKENVELAKKLILEMINPKDIDTIEFWVPEDACGRIIGRCGDNIRAISRSSNANVKVNRTESRDKKKLVTISGKANEIAAAKKLIEDIMEDYAEQVALRSFHPRTSPRKKGKNSEKGSPHDIIPQYEKLINTPNDSMVQVYVSSVATPSNFWLQLINPRAVELDLLVDEMTEYYNKLENQKLHNLKEVKKGQVVASRFQQDKKWYRVEVFSVKMNEANSDESEVDVFYVDYGDSAFQRLGDLFELKPEYLRLKFQAIEVAMAGIKPRSEEWEMAAIEEFEDMVHSAQWKVMLAQVVCHKEKTNSTGKGPIPFVRLYDPDGAPGVDIGSKLIENGFAIRDGTDEAASNDTLESDEENQEIWDL